MSGQQGNNADISSRAQDAPVGGKGTNNNGLRNEDPKAANPLTATNLDKLGQQQQQQEQQGATDDEEVESYSPPPATTDERLEQARIFLSDEDVNVSQDFAKKHQEIDAYLRRIEDEKIPCNVQVYMEVKGMLFVHKTRMDKQRYEGNRPIDYDRLPKHSQRLGLRDTSERASLRGAPLREDHPPFTLERKFDQQEFLRAFRADTEQGIALRALEVAAYDETLLHSSLVNEYLEEGPVANETENDKIERFSVRARKRGRRRAAVQIALRSFARNCEQHFAGGWDHRVIRLALPPVEEPAEPIMFAPLDREHRPRTIQPYRFTRKLLQFQEGQREMEEGFNEKLANSDITEGYTWLDYPNPSHKPTVVRARDENRLKILALLTFDVLVKMGSYFIMTGREHLTRARASVFVQEWAQPARLEIGGGNLPQQTKVRLVLAFFTEDSGWPVRYLATRAKSRPLTPQAIAALQQYIELRSDVNNATVSKLLTRLGTELADVWSRLRNNRLPEDESVNREEAIRTVRRIRVHRYERDKSKHRNRGRNAPLRELAQALDGNEAQLTHADAINLMSDRILNENHENERPQRVTLDEMWSFAANVPAESRNRNFFSIEQWSGFAPIKAGEEARISTAGKRKAGVDDESLPLPPPKRQRADDVDDFPPHLKRRYNAVAYESLNPDNPNPSRRLPPEEIGFVQVEETPEEHAPEIGSGELMPPEIKDFDYLRDGHVLENAPDMKENHQEGPPFFPFAETPFMQVLLGRQVANDMAPGSLDAAAQSIKADDTNILIPTQQFSLPQPVIDVSADVLDTAGVFNQRLPPGSNKRRRVLASDAQCIHRTSPSSAGGDDNDDNEGDRRGAKRQRTESPGRDERSPTHEETGPSDVNGPNDVDDRNGETGELGGSVKISSAPTEGGTSTQDTTSASYLSRLLKLGLPIRTDNDYQQPTTKTTMTTETRIETTTNETTDIPSNSNTETTTETMTTINLPLESPSSRTIVMETFPIKIRGPGDQIWTQDFGSDFGARPSKISQSSAWQKTIESFVNASGEDKDAKGKKRVDDGEDATDDEDGVREPPKLQPKSKTTTLTSAVQQLTQKTGFDPDTTSFTKVETKVETKTPAALKTSTGLPSPFDITFTPSQARYFTSKTPAVPTNTTLGPLDPNFFSTGPESVNFRPKTSAPSMKSAEEGSSAYDFTWRPEQPLVFGPKTSAPPATETTVGPSKSHMSRTEAQEKFGSKITVGPTMWAPGRNYTWGRDGPLVLGKLDGWPGQEVEEVDEEEEAEEEEEEVEEEEEEVKVEEEEEEMSEGDDDNDVESAGDVEGKDDRRKVYLPHLDTYGYENEQEEEVEEEEEEEAEVEEEGEGDDDDDEDSAGDVEEKDNKPMVYLPHLDTYGYEETQEEMEKLSTIVEVGEESSSDEKSKSKSKSKKKTTSVKTIKTKSKAKAKAKAKAKGKAKGRAGKKVKGGGDENYRPGNSDQGSEG